MVNNQNEGSNIKEKSEPPQRLLSYDEVLQKTTDGERALLLGNGFSMAYNKERFSFTDLRKSAIERGIIDKDGPINKTFEKFNTSDFESVIKALEDANKVLEAYGLNANKNFETDANKLKEHLIQIITNNHPEKATDLTLDEIRSCLAFIKRYTYIYTLNYDILLYWVIMRGKEVTPEASDPLFTDGFGNSPEDPSHLIFINEGKTKPTLCHLHGGLHLFNKGADVEKLTFSRTDIPLKEQIKANLDHDQYPVFISEGTSLAKKEKITHNPYLNHCYRSLCRLKKDLVIFGTGLKRNDEHIQNAIINSICGNVFIGVSSIDKISEWIPFEEAFKAKTPFFHRKPVARNIYYYDYHTINVWGHHG